MDAYFIFLQFYFFLIFCLFRHMILAFVVLGYGFYRALQIKQTGEASMQMWCIDVMTVTVMSICLIPALIKVFLTELMQHKLKK